MSTLVVTQQGAQVRCAGGQVLVELGGVVIARMPQVQMERVLLLGGIGLTTGFLNFALDRRIPVTFLTQDGHYKGRLDPGGRRDIAIRLAQYKTLHDLPFRQETARALVRVKVNAQRALLLRCARNHPVAALTGAAQAMEALQVRLPDAATLPQIMGIEGSAARLYFAALPSALRRPMPFRGRSRRPPRDPVNALLSLGYGLLSAEIIGALAGVGLDPQIGLFHSSRGRMPALAQDLLELFRAPVADALALSLVNLGILQEKQFESLPNGGIILAKPALEIYFRHYRRRMQATFRGRTGQPTSFRHEVQVQASHWRRVILREEPFVPFLAPLGGPLVKSNK